MDALDTLKAEVLGHIDRAMTMVRLLDIGPIHYNLASAADELRVAERLLEQFLSEVDDYNAMRNQQPQST